PVLRFGAAFRRVLAPISKSRGPRPVWNPSCPACSHTLTKASDACQIFAARARIVSGSQIRLNMSRDIHGRMLAREPCPLIRAFSAERPHQNEHHRKPGEKPKMHPPFEFGLARPSPITVIDQERSKHTCERDEDQPGPAHSGRLSWEVADSWRERRSRSSALYDACEWHHQHCGFGAALSSRGTDDTE